MPTVSSRQQGDERTTLAQARQAYLDGEFERCLALCDAVNTRDPAARRELAVLRARIHVRLDRGDRALEALRALQVDTLPVDEDAVAQMLTGAAYVRLGQKERGAALLEEALHKALDAHATVRAEAMLQLGIAKFRLGTYDAADALCANVGPEQDIVYAHSLEYRGWVAQARGEFTLAARRFREALSVLASCRRRDRYVEAKSLYGLTALCPELLLTQDWSALDVETTRIVDRD